MQSFPKLCLAAYKISTFNNFNTRMSHSLCFIICDWLVWSRVSQGRHESGSISRFLLSVEERSRPCWGISFYIAQCGELCISCFNTTCYRGGWPNRYKKPQEMWLDCYTRRIAIEKTFPVWYPEHQAHPTSRPACRTAKSYKSIINFTIRNGPFSATCEDNPANRP